MNIPQYIYLFIRGCTFRLLSICRNCQVVLQSHYTSVPSAECGSLSLHSDCQSFSLAALMCLKWWSNMVFNDCSSVLGSEFGPKRCLPRGRRLWIAHLSARVPLVSPLRSSRLLMGIESHDASSTAGKGTSVRTKCAFCWTRFARPRVRAPGGISSRKSLRL